VQTVFPASRSARRIGDGLDDGLRRLALTMQRGRQVGRTL
jgi:hypothetical protein